MPVEGRVSICKIAAGSGAGFGHRAISGGAALGVVEQPAVASSISGWGGANASMGVPAPAGSPVGSEPVGLHEGGDESHYAAVSALIVTPLVADDHDAILALGPLISAELRRYHAAGLLT